MICSRGEKVLEEQEVIEIGFVSLYKECTNLLCRGRSVTPVLVNLEQPSDDRRVEKI